MITKKINDFSIKQICDSGQCFRMNIIDDEKVSVIAGGKYIEISQSGNDVSLDCTEDDYESFWRGYFDIDSSTDYSYIKGLVMPDDVYLRNAVSFSYGIRILNQDLWEMIISFIISQRNNIKRIKGCIKRLCDRFGEGYAFPDPKALYEADIDDIKACGVGYRDVYIKRAAEAVFTGAFDLSSLYDLSYEEAKNKLLTLYGVGEKVADCICLFALHKLEAFPKDTHIISIVDNEYGGNFPFDAYGEYAGVLQQYMFYYDLCAKTIK